MVQRNMKHVNIPLKKIPKPHETKEALERMRLRIDYDPIQGTMTWEPGYFLNETDEKHHAGTRIGTSNDTGVLSFNFEGHAYICQRVAYALYHGHWPPAHIKFIDGNRANLCINNFKLVRSLFVKGDQYTRYNDTPFEGLLRLSDGTYSAYFQIENERKFVGRYETAELAHEARNKALTRRGEMQTEPLSDRKFDMRLMRLDKTLERRAIKSAERTKANEFIDRKAKPLPLQLTEQG